MMSNVLSQAQFILCSSFAKKAVLMGSSTTTEQL